MLCCFKKSTFCNADGCIEAGQWDNIVVMRDSKFDARGETSPVLSFTVEKWDIFLGRVKSKVDLNTVAHELGDVMVWHLDGTDTWFICRAGDAQELTFDREEWDAFVEGVLAGEFDSSVDQIAA